MAGRHFWDDLRGFDADVALVEAEADSNWTDPQLESLSQIIRAIFKRILDNDDFREVLADFYVKKKYQRLRRSEA